MVSILSQLTYVPADMFFPQAGCNARVEIHHKKIEQEGDTGRGCPESLRGHHGSCGTYGVETPGEPTVRASSSGSNQKVGLLTADYADTESPESTINSVAILSQMFRQCMTD
jgi:hypothetical protein